jgi:hypothetical protein
MLTLTVTYLWSIEQVASSYWSLIESMNIISPTVLNSILHDAWVAEPDELGSHLILDWTLLFRTSVVLIVVTPFRLVPN